VETVGVIVLSIPGLKLPRDNRPVSTYLLLLALPTAGLLPCKRPGVGETKISDIHETLAATPATTSLYYTWMLAAC